MKFHSPEQEKAYHKALKHKFKAAAFDIDGTLTKLAHTTIPKKLLLKLVETAKKIPLAICSGRDIDHIKNKFTDLTKSSKAFFIISENGGAAHLYNSKTKSYTQLFSIPWPDKIITSLELTHLLNKKLPWKIQVKSRDHSIVIYYPPIFYIFPALIVHLSKFLAASTRRIIKKEGYENYFDVEDSGIGTIIIPKQSGKGKAIKKLAKYLKIPINDFLVVGDMPEPGKNDAEFLSGKYGTAFTVGNQTHKTFPLPVYNEAGKKLRGPEGTLSLLQILMPNMIEALFKKSSKLAKDKGIKLDDLLADQDKIRHKT